MKRQKRCGVIYHHLDVNNELWFLVVVGRQEGHISFPKGCKMHFESEKECALRELREETGICERPELLVESVNVNGNTYFTLMSSHKFFVNQHMITDLREVERAEWMTVSSLLSQLNKCNKDIRRWISRLCLDQSSLSDN
jgi:8-oxo-dGTP pyrophosphatase MutT (NUDIX family)